MDLLLFADEIECVVFSYPIGKKSVIVFALHLRKQYEFLYPDCFLDLQILFQVAKANNRHAEH
jgi:hypothetical protein